MNKGGSPSGVKDPPIFATKKIKNTMRCTLFFLQEFARIKGRIISIAAPVVPIQLAKAVPINKIRVLIFGVPAKVPLITIPPAATNKENSKTKNGT